MNRKEIKNCIEKIFIQNGIFINEDEKIQIDSLKTTVLLLDLESEFNFSFPDEVISKVPNYTKSEFSFLVSNLVKGGESIWNKQK
ncbi:hypothetical protein ACT5YT_10945 [Leuconostoc suionicum]|uniref:hypothetical protein n=1 Tax=Leuconostoc suionicum TaxID=1511761 RepID=UPI004036F7D1